MHRTVHGRRSRLGRLGAAFVHARAQTYAGQPGRMAELLREARAKAEASRAALTDVWDELGALLRMLKAYADGSYRSLPWGTVVRIVGAVLYFAMPADLIPDVLAGLGFVDDAAVIAWTVRAVRTDLDAFRAWDASRRGAA